MEELKIEYTFDLEDFKTIDLSVIDNVIPKIN